MKLIVEFLGPRTTGALMGLMLGAFLTRVVSHPVEFGMDLLREMAVAIPVSLLVLLLHRLLK